MKNFEELSPEERVQHYDELLFEVEKEIKDFESFIKQFKKTQKKVNELSKYVFSDQWMEDHDRFQVSDGLHITGQDYAYNAIVWFDNKQLQLLKMIAKDL